MGNLFTAEGALSSLTSIFIWIPWKVSDYEF